MGGRVSAKAVIEAVEEETCLITVMHSNNEIGSLQPIGEIGRLLDADHKRFGHIWFHTDAAQSISKVNFDVSQMQRLDLATIVGTFLYLNLAFVLTFDVDVDVLTFFSNYT